MKIAMIAWEFPPQFSGGLGVHCQCLVEELVKQGVCIDYYLPTDGDMVFHIPEGMVLHRLDIGQQSSAYSDGDNRVWESIHSFRASLEEAFQPQGVDVIHAHDWMGVYAAMRIQELYGIPLIWTVHSTEYDRAAGLPPHPGILAIEQAAFQSATHTITVSARTKESLISKYGVDPGAVSVIYNGIHASSFQGLAVDRDYGTPEGYVLFLGRVTGQKGPGDFLKAARMIIAERETRFMIAGDGNLLGPLRRQAHRWKMDEHITFTGTVKGEQLQKCYKDAQIYVLPSISEPFGITVLEAMASGIPTIITTTTGVSEIVQNVCRVEPGNPKQLAKAIITLLDNPILQQSLAQRGVQEVQCFSWKSIADQTLLLYSQWCVDDDRKEP
jgi:glycogen(starch) synthase